MADGEGNVRSESERAEPELADEAHKAGVKVLALARRLGLGQAVRVDRGQARGGGPLREGRDGDRRRSPTTTASTSTGSIPTPKEEVVGFERLARRFRKELDALGRKKGRPMVLTMAASSNPARSGGSSKEFLLETMDWINVMTYDYRRRLDRLRGPQLAALRLVEAAGRQASRRRS